MSTPPVNQPMPVQPTPVLVDAELVSLLAEPLARAWSNGGLAGTPGQALRDRLAQRLVASRQAEAAMVTTRRRRAARQLLAAGVTEQTLYRARPGAPLRPGEPLQARLIELAPGAAFDLATLTAAVHREWLVVSGSTWLDGQWLSARDYHVVPAGHAAGSCSSESGALLFLRESAQPARERDQPFTVRDADSGWPDFAPGIQRRVLWQRDGQAALLYFAQPGAQVPRHRHGHDEECLMVQGELFLDDLLLQVGDYQLAPAGSGHRVTQTDTGVVIYAHGDLDLQFVG